MGKVLADAPGLDDREEVGLFVGTRGAESKMAPNPGGEVSLDSAGRSVVAACLHRQNQWHSHGCGDAGPVPSRLWDCGTER